MLGEGLSPGVENRGDADRAAQMTRVAAECEQRVGRRTKEQRVDHPGLPWARALRSCGSVKTTWKYGIGSRSALRAASHHSFAAV